MSNSTQFIEKMKSIENISKQIDEIGGIEKLSSCGLSTYGDYILVKEAKNMVKTGKIIRVTNEDPTAKTPQEVVAISPEVYLDPTNDIELGDIVFIRRDQFVAAFSVDGKERIEQASIYQVMAKVKDKKEYEGKIKPKSFTEFTK